MTFVMLKIHVLTWSWIHEWPWNLCKTVNLLPRARFWSGAACALATSSSVHASTASGARPGSHALITPRAPCLLATWPELEQKLHVTHKTYKRHAIVAPGAFTQPHFLFNSWPADVTLSKIPEKEPILVFFFPNFSIYRTVFISSKTWFRPYGVLQRPF